MQNSQGAAIANQAPARATVPDAPTAPEAPVALPPVPARGGQLVIDRQGHRTIITSASLPPDIMPLASMARETALGLMGLLAVIIIVGPFARMIARRLGNRPQMQATTDSARMLHQQLELLQQSVDAMSLEVERISESQRFQSKLLAERKG